MQVPNTLICDNRECKHPLSDHLSGEYEAKGASIEDMKSFSFPCLFFERDTGTFTVCSCRDFELPARSEAEPETPDEPIHTIPLEGDVILILWASGKVTWDPR